MIADPARIDQLAVAIQDWNSRHARLDSRPIGVSDLLLPALPKVDAPIVGIWGARDHAMQGEPQRAEAALRAVRPDTNFRVIADSGHWVAYETPDAFAQTLRETHPSDNHAGRKSEGRRI
jgi:2-hydroxy-6-oxonona-2,4-dienedioate hydrolase